MNQAQEQQQDCQRCHQQKASQQVHCCWRCGLMVCEECAYPDRHEAYECVKCLLWQRTCEVIREPSYDD